MLQNTDAALQLRFCDKEVKKRDKQPINYQRPSAHLKLLQYINHCYITLKGFVGSVFTGLNILNEN